MITRQDIITWYTPEEKLPPKYADVVVTFSGCRNNKSYDHVLAMAYYDRYIGWVLDAFDDLDDYRVHAWCDLEPYKGGKA